jgi:NAD+-dependent protein deacetylase sirtuin 4
MVFFGDNVSVENAAISKKAAEECDMVLAVGTSLSVWSAFRIVKAARSHGARVAIIGLGQTRGDELATTRIFSDAREFLAGVVPVL